MTCNIGAWQTDGWDIGAIQHSIESLPGNIFGFSTISLSLSATLAGTGNLSQHDSLEIRSTGTLTGTGIISSLQTSSITSSSSISGVGNIAGFLSNAINNTGLITGVLPISGQLHIDIDTIGFLSSPDSIHSAQDLIFHTNGTLSGVGSISSVIQKLILNEGTLLGVKNISTQFTFSFYTIGELTEESPSNRISGLLFIGYILTGTLTGIAHAECTCLITITCTATICTNTKNQPGERIIAIAYYDRTVSVKIQKRKIDIQNYNKTIKIRREAMLIEEREIYLGATLDFTFDWSRYLENGDKIIESTWRADPGLTISNMSHTGTKTVLWVTPTTNNTSSQFIVANRIVTQSGIIDIRMMRLKVLQQKKYSTVQ